MKYTHLQLRLDHLLIRKVSRQLFFIQKKFILRLVLVLFFTMITKQVLRYPNPSVYRHIVQMPWKAFAWNDAE